MGAKTIAVLKVIGLTPHIREYLLQNDPEALRQVEERIVALEARQAKLQALAEEYRARVPPEFRLP